MTQQCKAAAEGQLEVQHLGQQRHAAAAAALETT
jgi:hypothetical protein